LNYLREVANEVSLVTVQNAFDLHCGGLCLDHFQALEEHGLEINAEHRQQRDLFPQSTTENAEFTLKLRTTTPQLPLWIKAELPAAETAPAPLIPHTRHREGAWFCKVSNSPEEACSLTFIS